MIKQLKSCLGLISKITQRSRMSTLVFGIPVHLFKEVIEVIQHVNLNKNSIVLHIPKVRFFILVIL